MKTGNKTRYNSKTLQKNKAIGLQGATHEVAHIFVLSRSLASYHITLKNIINASICFTEKIISLCQCFCTGALAQ